MPSAGIIQMPLTRQIRTPSARSPPGNGRQACRLTIGARASMVVDLASKELVARRMGGALRNYRKAASFAAPRAGTFGSARHFSRHFRGGRKSDAASSEGTICSRKAEPAGDGRVDGFIRSSGSLRRRVTESAAQDSSTGSPKSFVLISVIRDASPARCSSG